MDPEMLVLALLAIREQADDDGHAGAAMKLLLGDESVQESWSQDDEHKHHRDHGKFASGAGGSSGGEPEATHDSPTPAEHPHAKLHEKALHWAGGPVRAAKALAGKVGQKVWDTLDPDEQKFWSGAYATGKYLLHKAEFAFSKGKELIHETAKQRGATDEQATRAARIVSVVDQVLAWTVSLPLVTAATGNPFAGKASSFLPLASAAYLAYSAASDLNEGRDPLATLRAAWNVLAKKTSHAAHESVQGSGVEALVAGIMAADDRADWYEALVMVALDRAGDLAAAVGAADEAMTGGTAGVHEEKTHRFGCVYFPLPEDITQQVRDLAATIPDEHLAEDGREDDPHITLLFGLHTEDSEEVRNALAGAAPVRVRLGSSSIFPSSKSGSGDVVKLDVFGPELHDLHDRLALALPHTDTHPEYNPHLTLAYVLPGKGKRYEGMGGDLDGYGLLLDSVVFSAADGSKTTIPLSGQDHPAV